ncbi:MAG: class I SAM-dependent methyltransferase [Eubacteriales bacterium]
MDAYSILSKIYDISRQHEDTQKWYDFIKNILKKYSMQKGCNMLDCGCGTGDISIFLAKAGYIVDAIDSSGDMLIQAKEKTHNQGLHINYTLQDMKTFKFNKKFSLISCINDGINYLTKLDDVKLFFENCSRHMDSGAFLLFDISTRKKLQDMNNEFFAEDNEEFAYIWSNQYDYENHILSMDITFFTQIDDDIFERSSEIHLQRGHSIDELTLLLSQSGFSIVDIFSDISFDRPNDSSDRIHFLAQKL